MALVGPKQLMTQFRFLSVATNDSGVTWTYPNGLGNWRERYVYGSNWLWQVKEIDLSGLSAEELTTQLVATSLQRPYEPIATQNLGQDPWAGYINLYMYVTDVPLIRNETDINAFALNAVQGTYPSFPTAQGSPELTDTDAEYPRAISWQNLIYAEQIAYASSSTTLGLNGMTAPLYSRLYGSGEATASDRLYITAIWRIAAPYEAEPTSSVAYFPPLRLAIAAEVFEEKDLAYVDRLRRSYLEQRGFDND